MRPLVAAGLLLLASAAHAQAVRVPIPAPEITLWSYGFQLSSGNSLGGYKLPARAFRLTFVTGKVTTASGGGAGSSIITLTDGTNTCTATLLCTASSSLNAVLRFTVANGSGTGCSFPANAAISASVTTATCTTTNPTLLPMSFGGVWQ